MKKENKKKYINNNNNNKIENKNDDNDDDISVILEKEDILKVFDQVKFNVKFVERHIINIVIHGIFKL